MPITTDSADDGLRAELADIERQFHGWHLWLDTGGRINATHLHGTVESAAAARGLRVPYAGSGVTLDAGCPATIRWLIADWMHHWSCALHHMAGAA